MSFQESIRRQGFSYRLHSLTQSFGRKFDRIQKISLKLRLLDPCAYLSPRLLRKMAQWVAQLSQLQAQEKKILDRICAIERKHKKHLERKRVRFARPKPQHEMAPEPKRNSKWIWFFLFLLLLMENRRKNAPALSAPRNG